MQHHRSQFANLTIPISSKTLRHLLIANGVKPRAESTWKSISTALDFGYVWINIWTSRNDNDGKTIKWKVTHRVLVTKAYLRWGFNIDSACPFCTYPEDMIHALITCQRAQKLWRWLLPIIRQIYDHPVDINLQTALLIEGITRGNFVATW